MAAINASSVASKYVHTPNYDYDYSIWLTNKTSVTRNGQRVVHVSFVVKTVSSPMQEAHVTREEDSHHCLARDYRLTDFMFRRAKIYGRCHFAH
jgi:hypothetical protein